MDLWALTGLDKIFTLQNILTWLVVTVVVFLVIREILTWYWKINRIVDLLEKIEENTRPFKTPQENSVPGAGSNQSAFSKWWNGTQ